MWTHQSVCRRLKSSTFGLIRFNRHALCLIAFNGQKVKQSNATDDKNFPCTMIQAKNGIIFQLFFSFRLSLNRKDFGKSPDTLVTRSQSVSAQFTSASVQIKRVLFLCCKQHKNTYYHFNSRSLNLKFASRKISRRLQVVSLITVSIKCR